jgi:transcriptional regulator of acetoin/glycerol metabolism
MDLIDRMIRRLQHIEPGVDATRLSALEDALRQEMGGTVARVRKRRKTKAAQVAEVLDSEFTGDVELLAARLGVHRATIYRVLRSRPRNNFAK